jgi:hypothetical protein
MKKLFLAFTLLFFSTFSFAGDCPDGSDPVRSISDDGTYFVYNCAGGSNNSSNSSSQSSSSSSSSSLTKDNSIVTYEVVFAADILQELLERVLSKTDFDFSKHKLTSNADNWRCNFDMRRVNYEDSVGGTIESWSAARGAIIISGSKISFAKGSAWDMGGLSTDPSYLQDEVNLKLTDDGTHCWKDGLLYFWRSRRRGPSKAQLM